MNVIFLGDLASPNIETAKTVAELFQNNQGIFSGKKIICNLEGLIYDGEKLKNNEPVLYNHSSILSVLARGNKSIFCLANNHVLDMPQHFNSTAALLKSEGHFFLGAGLSRKEAEEPLRFTGNAREFILFNACWDFLLYNHPNPRSGIHVSELREQKLITRIRDIKVSEPDCGIIVCIHWNLDLETLPFPMYRQFSRDLVTAGANLVLGTHSHCVQGGEKYRDGYILYGLGNFIIPNHEFAGGNLSFPSFAGKGLVLEWDSEKNKCICHWFTYSNKEGQHQMEYTGSEYFETGERLKDFTPYRDMDHKDYIYYYKKNRRKKILIPVYRDYRRRRLNAFYTVILKLRARTARLLARFHLIKWQN